MTAKTLARPTVEFYTTSPRLAQAYRSAAKRNKGLSRHAGMCELEHAILAHEPVKHVGHVQIVVLSHAEEDYLELTDKRVEPVVTGAFHLLFTEPTTHRVFLNRAAI